MIGEILELLRTGTAHGGLFPRFRLVPFSIKVPRQTGAGTAGGRVGEGQAVPVASFSYDSITPEPEKIEASIVVSRELIRPTPSAVRTLGSSILGGVERTTDR
jgi:hypothetical protein